MEQRQGLLMHIAVGLRRLEADFSAEECEVPSVEERARRTTIRIATAANRCSWCSVCELACYITTGALARRTHIPIEIFMSRPMYMLQECRRILQRGDHSVVSAPNVELDGARPGRSCLLCDAIKKQCCRACSRGNAAIAIAWTAHELHL